MSEVIGTFAALVVIAAGGVQLVRWAIAATETFGRWLNERALLPWRNSRRGQSSPWPAEHDEDGREVHAYAMAAFAWEDPQLVLGLKFGLSIDPHRRAKEEDERQQLANVVLLAWGPGGRAREEALHDRLDRLRYPRSEYFTVARATLAAAAEFEQRTLRGESLLS